MKEEFLLPSEVSAGASVQGNEYGWRPAAFSRALGKACALGYACLGRQFQFRVPGATCEMYWINADPDDRGPQEHWKDFQPRSCRETLERFEKRLAETNFMAEARRWTTVRELSGRHAKPLDHLCFVAYFVSEEEHKALGEQVGS